MSHRATEHMEVASLLVKEAVRQNIRRPARVTNFLTRVGSGLDTVHITHEITVQVETDRYQYERDPQKAIEVTWERYKEAAVKELVSRIGLEPLIAYADYIAHLTGRDYAQSDPVAPLGMDRGFNE